MLNGGDAKISGRQGHLAQDGIMYAGNETTHYTITEWRGGNTVSTFVNEVCAVLEDRIHNSQPEVRAIMTQNEAYLARTRREIQPYVHTG